MNGNIGLGGQSDGLLRVTQDWVDREVMSWNACSNKCIMQAKRKQNV